MGPLWRRKAGRRREGLVGDQERMRAKASA
jgi:hypothetical protein